MTDAETLPFDPTTIDTEDVDRGYDEAFGCRVYEYAGYSLPSVTSVLERLDQHPSGAGMSSLDEFEYDHQGDGDDFNAKHVLWYTSLRGTLAHYEGLDPLADRELWGDEEREAVAGLRGLRGDRVEGARPTDVLYSVLRWQRKVDDRAEFFEDYGVPLPSHRIVSKAEREVEQFVERYGRMIGKLGVDEVIDVERYLFRPDMLVAGQVDLVYRSVGGDVVAADLKTSGSLQDKHAHQIDAYARAHPADVDRVEVHRIKPSGHARVHTPESEAVSKMHDPVAWPDDRRELWLKYQELAEAWQDEYREHYAPDADAGDDAREVEA